MSRNRTSVRRQPRRGLYDRESIGAVLDAGLVGHVAFVDSGQPYCIPMLYARIDDSLYVHGSRASRTIRTLAAGAPACVTVTLIDGLVLARSAFEHSANYRSVVLLGVFRLVDQDRRKLEAFQAFTNKVIPGRWKEVRAPNARELKSAAILELPYRRGVGEGAGRPSERRRFTGWRITDVGRRLAHRHELWRPTAVAGAGEWNPPGRKRPVAHRSGRKTPVSLPDGISGREGLGGRDSNPQPTG